MIEVKDYWTNKITFSYLPKDVNNFIFFNIGADIFNHTLCSRCHLLYNRWYRTR